LNPGSLARQWMEITVDLLEFVLAAADNWGGADGAYRDRCRKGIFRPPPHPLPCQSNDQATPADCSAHDRPE
jgi:hypothetical protein